MDNWERIDTIINRKNLLLNPLRLAFYNFNVSKQKIKQKLKKSGFGIVSLVIVFVEKLIAEFILLVYSALKVLLLLGTIPIVMLLSGLLVHTFEQAWNSIILSIILYVLIMFFAIGLVVLLFYVINWLYWLLLFYMTNFTKCLRFISKADYMRIDNLDNQLWNVWQNTTSMCVYENPKKAKAVMKKLRFHIFISQALYSQNKSCLVAINREIKKYLEIVKH